MIDFGALLTVFRAESRLTLRLARFWVFSVIAFLLTALAFTFYSVLHYFLSAQMPFMGTIAPRYLVAGLGNLYLMIFCIGLVFLGFDIRARDTRERMYEVLDARPFGNVELILGRAAAQVGAAWLPLIFTLVLVWAIGSIFGEGIFPSSIFGIGVLMAIPAYIFTLGLTYVVTLLVKNRLIAAVLMVGLLVGSIFGINLSTLRSVSIADIYGGYALEFPSAIVPSMIDGYGILHRIAILVGGIGLLLVAAALYPRLDDGRRELRGVVGAALFAACIVGVVAGLVLLNQRADRQAGWLEAHRAVAAGEGLHIVSVRADVEIDRGRSISASATLELGNEGGAPLSPVVLTLNPGLRIESLQRVGGGAIAFEQRDGLVILDSSISPGQSLGLDMAWGGAPLFDFAYLDAANDLLGTPVRDAGIALLGYRPGFMSRKYVALPPDVHWMPSAGAAFARQSSEAPRRDPFELELTVAAPEGWLVAAPGRRHQEEGRFRFSPGAPVPAFALVAGPFVSRAHEIREVQFEILLNPTHADALESLAPAKERLFEKIESMLTDASESGLAYPYDGFTIIEVPATMRSWGGGWRMDSTLAPPAMFLMRESALAAARWDVVVKRFDAGESGSELDEVLTEAVERYFLNDITGSNVIAGATRNLLRYQVAARGDGAEVLDFALEQLATRLVMGRFEYFSVHVFDRDVGNTMQSAGFEMARGEDNTAYARSVLERRTSGPEAWDALLGSAIKELDPWEEPGLALDVLVLKTQAMADAFRVELGRQGAGELLASLVAAHRGGTYDRDDVAAAAGDQAPRVAALLEQWLDSPALPGFVVDATRIERITDRDDGTPRYQIELLARNAEPVPGILQVAYKVEGQEGGRSERIDPIAIAGRSAVRIGVVTSRPVSELRIEPFLSLNRGPFAVPLAEFEEEAAVEAEPFEGVEPVPWSADAEGIVIVDDLDEGFEVDGGKKEGALRVGSRRGKDGAAIPAVVFGRWPKTWSRATADQAYGRYRHTAAVLSSPDEGARAAFTAEIPASGRYRLDLHVAEDLFFRSDQRGLGRWAVTVGDADAVTLDAANAGLGWNAVGEFELGKGAIRIALAPGEECDLLVADAIRLAPVAGSPQAGGSR